MRLSPLFLILIAALFSSVAVAGPKLTLKEKRVVKEVEKQIADVLARTNKKCESKVKVEVDWSSFKKANAIGGTRSTIASACRNSIDQIDRVCNDDDGKAAIQEGVSKVVCTYIEKEKVDHELKKSVVTEKIWVHPEGGEYHYQSAPALSAFLAENL